MTNRSVLATADFSPLAVAGRPDAFTTIRDGSAEYNIFQGLFRPGDKNWVYLAAVESDDGNPHLLVSSDAGGSWTVRDWPSDVGSGTFWRMDQTGATGLIGQANFAVAADGRIFVVCNDLNFDTSDPLSALNGIYASDDDGATWTKILDPPAPTPQSGYSIASGQGPYGGFMGIWVGDTSLWTSACYGYAEVDSGPTNMIANDGELRALRYALIDYSTVSDELVWRPETVTASAAEFDAEVTDTFTRTSADTPGSTESPVIPWAQYVRGTVLLSRDNNHFGTDGQLVDYDTGPGTPPIDGVTNAFDHVVIFPDAPMSEFTVSIKPWLTYLQADGGEYGAVNIGTIVFWWASPGVYWMVDLSFPTVHTGTITPPTPVAAGEAVDVSVGVFDGAGSLASGTTGGPVVGSGTLSSGDTLTVHVTGDTIEVLVNGSSIGTKTYDYTRPRGSGVGIVGSTRPDVVDPTPVADDFDFSYHGVPALALTSQRWDYGKQLTGVRGQDAPVWVCKETANTNPDSSTAPPRVWRIT